MPLIHLLVYCFTLWLGLYLLGRDSSKIGLRYAGLGLISYAIGLVLNLFLATNPEWLRLPMMLPTLFWLSAVFHLLPDVPSSKGEIFVVRGAWLYSLLIFLLGFFNDALARWLSIALPLLFIMGIQLRWQQVSRMGIPRPPFLIMGTAALFLALSGYLVILPQSWLSQDWAVLLMSVDLLLLGFAVAVLDAYDEGTNLLPDALRSFIAAALALILIGGQVIIVIRILGESPALLMLLFGLMTTLLIGIVFYDKLQSFLDSFVLGKEDKHKRENLRAATHAVLQTAEAPAIAHMEMPEFARITRRALSHYGDLSKLAASPLLQLPCLEAEDESILARANALKALLRETVEELKPQSLEDFAPQDEWRFYNALYFPYVRGLKPYSRRYYEEELSPADAQALEWFRAQVPERTLYNWQNTAADLIAQRLRETLA
jgi:hypothetical protein